MRILKYLKKVFREKVYAWSLVIALLIFWEASVRIMDLPGYFLPAPTDIIRKIMGNIPLLAMNTWVTLYEVLLGFALGIAIGVPLAILIVYVPILEKSVYSSLVSANAIPKVALAPILVVWLGFGLMPKLVVAFLICFFPIVVNTVIGMKSISPEMIKLSRILGASGWQQFFKFRLPQALPSIFGGLKIGVTLAVVGAIVGEYVAAERGLGYVQMVFAGNLDTAMVFAVLIILSVMSVVLFNVVALIEKLTVRGNTEELTDCDTKL